MNCANHALMADKIDSWVHWEHGDPEAATAVLSDLARQHPAALHGSSVVLTSSSRLSFYTDHRLMELALLRDTTVEHVFVLLGSDGVFWLNGDLHGDPPGQSRKSP